MAREELMKLLQQIGIPSSPVNPIDEVIDHPQTEHRNMIMKTDHKELVEIDMVDFPGKMSGIEQEIRHTPPVHGDYTKEALLELGYSEAEIDDIVPNGIAETDE